MARILVIDRTSLREHCCQMLRDAGHQVRGTHEGSIGVELLRACNFDVVLTSTAVGDLHGAALIQSIAELQNSPSILVMSWYWLILEELAAAHLDIAATIWKFELPETLLPVLKRVLLARHQKQLLSAALARDPGRAAIERRCLSGRVLLVESVKRLQRALREFLSEAGHEVSCADDPTAAWQMLEQGTYDLLLAHANFGAADDFERAAQLQRRWRSTDVILYGEQPMKQQSAALRLSVADCLYLPLSEGLLRNTLTRVLKQRRVALQLEELGCDFPRG